MAEIDARFRRLVEIMAAERTREHPELFDDCVQEGLIAAWEAMERFAGKPDAYYHAAARYGVLAPLRGRSATGAASRQGRADAHDHSGPLVVESDGVEYIVFEPIVDPSYDDDGPAIRAAVADLDEDDRAMVFGRYWQDLGFADLAPVIGRPAGTLSRRWTQIVRPALAERLADLAA